MFKVDNCDYPEGELAMLNRILAEYIGADLADWQDDARAQREKSGADAIANAWFPGITEPELRAAVLK